MSFRNTLNKYLDNADKMCLCEYCEDGDKDFMNEIKLIHHESLEHIYKSEEAYIHEADYQCPECKLIVNYSYDNGSVHLDYDISEWKFFDDVYP